MQVAVVKARASSFRALRPLGGRRRRRLVRTQECWQFKERRGRSTVSREPAAESAREEGGGMAGSRGPQGGSLQFTEWSAWSGVGAQPQSVARGKHTFAHWPPVQVSVCPPCLRSFCPSIHPQASSPLGSRDWSWGREPAPAGTEAGVRAGSRACEEAWRSHPHSRWADGPVPRGPSPCSSSFSHTRVSWPLSSQRKRGISEARRGLPVQPCLPPPR